MIDCDMIRRLWYTKLIIYCIISYHTQDIKCAHQGSAANKTWKECRGFSGSSWTLNLGGVKQLFQQKNPRGRTASVKRETRLPDILSWARFAHTKWHDISAHFLPYLARPLQRKPFPALFGGFFVTASWRANCLSTSTGSYQAVRMAFEITLPL